MTGTEYWVESAELDRVEPLRWSDAGNSQLFSCRYDDRPYLYKEYADDFRRDADQHALGDLIRWRDTLSEYDRDKLDSMAAWPRFRVRRDGFLRGVLLPFAPERFYERDGSAPRPRMLSELIRLKAAGEVRPGARGDIKQTALGHAIEVLLWFHSQRVVVNDVREVNILCARWGTDVFYVDCDVMVGPWRPVGPPAAPAYMQNAIPGLDRPSRETDVARLAWMAAAILLDDLALPEVRADQLRKVTDPGAAQLLAEASRPGPIDDDRWRKLVDRWTAPRWEARARVPGQEPEPVAASLPPTRPVPIFVAEQVGTSFRVPERFRRADPVYGLPPAPMLPVAPTPPSPLAGLSDRARLALILGIVGLLALCGLVTLSMSLRGMAL